mmetsp:Transcript_47961/g.111920  ORF Transcript_47961/g.111920 Transcript_47961/m.111920 type:complete len:724 (+) Transcript_47961:1-2172(+)
MEFTPSPSRGGGMVGRLGGNHNAANAVQPQEILVGLGDADHRRKDSLQTFQQDLRRLEQSSNRVIQSYPLPQAKDSSNLAGPSGQQGCGSAGSTAALLDTLRSVPVATDMSKDDAQQEPKVAPPWKRKNLGLGCPTRKEAGEEDGLDADAFWEAASPQQKGGGPAFSAAAPLSPILESSIVESPSSQRRDSVRSLQRGVASLGGARPSRGSDAPLADRVMPRASRESSSFALGLQAACPSSASSCSSPMHSYRPSPRASPRMFPQSLGTEAAGLSKAAAKVEKCKVIQVNGVGYKQLQVIGRGGSCKVYLVEDADGEVLALKRVQAQSAKQLEGFQNEVALLQQLRGNPSVIQVFDSEVDYERQRILIVMEAGDMDLGAYLHKEPRLSLAQIQSLWKQMIESVQAIHDKRIVHSDLKPGNFLLVRGRLKVIDFGIARKLSEDTTNITAAGGTFSYMAPEAVSQGTKLGRPADIWSLGVILYQMVYGCTPLAHLDDVQKMVELSKPTPAIRFPAGHCLEKHADVTKAQLMDVLQGCLQRDPRKRLALQDLLAHPFLRSSHSEVQRHTVDRLVQGLMEGVLSSLRQADLVSTPEEAPRIDWRALVDEAWDFLGRDAEKELAASARSSGKDPALPVEFQGLAPLQEHVRQHLRQTENLGGSRGGGRNSLPEKVHSHTPTMRSHENRRPPLEQVSAGENKENMPPRLPDKDWLQASGRWVTPSLVLK